MRSRVPKETRENAILICAIAASTVEPVMYNAIAGWLGLEPRGTQWEVAIAAWREVSRVDNATPLPSGRSWSQVRDAEAEVLLRDGWDPGDPAPW